MNIVVIAKLLAAAVVLTGPAVAAEAPLKITPLTERKVAELPPGPLFWRIESVTTPAKAQKVDAPWTLAAESDGSMWLFTLGPAGGSTPGTARIAEVGPIPRV